MCDELRLEWPALAAALSAGPPDAVASALRKAARAVDAAQSACAWPRQLQLRRRLLLACEGRCEAAAPERLQLLRRLHAAAAARALQADDVSYFLHISKSGGSSVCAAATNAAIRAPPGRHSDCNVEQHRNGTLHYSPRWFGNAWNRQARPASCAALLDFARRGALQLVASERACSPGRRRRCTSPSPTRIRCPTPRATGRCRPSSRHPSPCIKL
jgi:hypothetical protein